MARLSDEQRKEIARKRLINILERHGIATARTLEQKISDAGPNPQRIDPHKTPKRIIIIKRLNEQLSIFKELSSGLKGRVGQALEIAIYRALLKQNQMDFFGTFKDLDKHKDSIMYTKEEPPQTISGKRLEGNQRLDFLVRHRHYQADCGWAGIEAKNVREWLYPDRKEIKEFLSKCLILDCIPVLIGRRIPFVTFLILGKCGVVFHQTYNQLLPESDKELANKAKDKNLLGYHDIRTGNQPDQRMKKFISQNLPNVLPKARNSFDDYKDLLKNYVKGMNFNDFSAHVQMRSQGMDEDLDFQMPDDMPF